MLGANYGPVGNVDGVGWPYCGEIDIMEQFVDKTYIKSTCHWNNNGSTASYGLPVDLATPTEFHVYSLEWNAGSIKALLDGVQFYSLSTSSAMPFDANFFFIFNLAMGGSNGGTIDPNFTSDSMEVDYVRVYQ
jgi:beta-glucanase (GH16 family)